MSIFFLGFLSGTFFVLSGVWVAWLCWLPDFIGRTGNQAFDKYLRNEYYAFKGFLRGQHSQKDKAAFDAFKASRERGG